MKVIMKVGDSYMLTPPTHILTYKDLFPEGAEPSQQQQQGDAHSLWQNMEQIHLVNQERFQHITDAQPNLGANIGEMQHQQTKMFGWLRRRFSSLLGSSPTNN
ncbi:hypothetical protein Fmac_025751 [Flemingia macrophylla]|uniref:Uncharacterized protein n=1 Tax=Flemingia macrophylla TaxID=520843 RepID=A0ABD1LT58_9FABA